MQKSMTWQKQFATSVGKGETQAKFGSEESDLLSNHTRILGRGRRS